MLEVLSHTRVLRLAGLFTWVMVGLPLVLLAAGEPSALRWGLLSFIAYLAFGAAYFWLTRDLRSGGHASALDRAMLVDRKSVV